MKMFLFAIFLLYNQIFSGLSTEGKEGGSAKGRMEEDRGPGEESGGQGRDLQGRRICIHPRGSGKGEPSEDINNLVG